MTQNYRNSDPPTSAMAGQDIEASGSAHRHRTLCLEVVAQTPGLTAREIEDRLGIKAHKRLPELRRDGMVRNGRSRTCAISGRQAMTWYPGIDTVRRLKYQKHSQSTPKTGELA